MDERLSGWEERLRHELDAAVREVRADDGLVVAARAGGRRRLRRRRALASLPAAALVAGGAVWAVGGAGRSAPTPVPPAQSATQDGQDTQTAVPDPVPDASSTAPDPGARDDQSLVDAFYAAGYTYDDAVQLGQIWHVDSWEAKVTGGQKLMAGQTLPVEP